MIPVGILTAAATSSFSFLLDLYPGASAAYSFRKLRSAYTGNCIKVLNTSGAIADIGFKNNVLDTTALLTFCAGQNGNVITVYDQSGNGNDAIATPNNNGGKIVDTGVLVTDNGKVAINSGYYSITNSLAVNVNYSCFSVMSRTGTNKSTAFGIDNTNFIFVNLVEDFVRSTNGTNRGSYAHTATGRYLFITYNISNNFTMYLNSTNKTVTQIASAGTGNLKVLNAWIGFAYFSTNLWQEQIFYSNNQLANNTGISNNINTFYTIY